MNCPYQVRLCSQLYLFLFWSLPLASSCLSCFIAPEALERVGGSEFPTRQLRKEVIVADSSCGGWEAGRKELSGME